MILNFIQNVKVHNNDCHIDRKLVYNLECIIKDNLWKLKFIQMPAIFFELFINCLHNQQFYTNK